MSPAKSNESSDCGTAVLRDSFDVESSFVVPQEKTKLRKKISARKRNDFRILFKFIT